MVDAVAGRGQGHGEAADRTRLASAPDRGQHAWIALTTFRPVAARGRWRLSPVWEIPAAATIDVEARQHLRRRRVVAQHDLDDERRMPDRLLVKSPCSTRPAPFELPVFAVDGQARSVGRSPSTACGVSAHTKMSTSPSLSPTPRRVARRQHGLLSRVWI